MLRALIAGSMKYFAWIIVIVVESEVPGAVATPLVATGAGIGVAAEMSLDDKTAGLGAIGDEVPRLEPAAALAVDIDAQVIEKRLHTSNFVGPERNEKAKLPVGSGQVLRLRFTTLKLARHFAVLSRNDL